LPIAAGASIAEAGFSADVDGARALSEQLAQSPNARACVAQQLFTFTFGRRPAFEASAFSLQTLIAELATSDDFRARIEPAQVMP
jgi:hypothetical protein